MTNKFDSMIIEGPALYGLDQTSVPTEFTKREKLSRLSRSFRKTFRRYLRVVTHALARILLSVSSAWPFDKEDAKLLVQVVAISSALLWSLFVIGLAAGLAVSAFNWGARAF